MTETAVNPDQAADEALEQAHDADLEADRPPEGRLIDPAQYEPEELQLPSVDGEHVDKIYVAFGGRAWLDRGSPEDCALIRDLRMGQRVTLMVNAVVGPAIPGFSTNREGDLDAVILGRKLTVGHLWRASHEQVSAALEEGPEGQ